MSDSDEGQFKELPKWPDEAKELPEKFQKRHRSEWGIGTGAVVAAATYFLFYGAPLAFMIVLLLGGFLVGHFIGRGIERSIQYREQKWDR